MILKILYYASSFSALPGLLVFLKWSEAKTNNVFKWVGLLLLGSFLSDLLGIINRWTIQMNDHFKHNFYIFYFLLIVLNLFQTHHSGTFLRYWKYILLGLIIGPIFLLGFRTFHEEISLISNIIVLTLSINFFIGVLNKEDDIKLTDNPLFWIICVVLFNSAGGLFVNLMITQIITSQNMALWTINQAINILTNLSLATITWLYFTRMNN